MSQYNRLDQIHQGPQAPSQVPMELSVIFKQLDIVRITNRIIVCGTPIKGKTDASLHMNNIADLALFLNTRYGNKYLIWNLSADSSQGLYDTKPFRGQVVSIPFSKAYNTSLKTILDICKSMHGWLSLDDENVCIVHSANGISKVATAICSYLCFSQTVHDSTEALQYFKYRIGMDLKTAIPSSQQRYLEYFDNLVALGGNLSNPYPLCIQEIILNGIPRFGNTLDWTPGLEIYENGSLLLSTVSKRKGASSQIPVEVIRNDHQVSFQLPKQYSIVVERDIQIRIFRQIKTHAVNQIVTIASFSFHTGFMPTEGVVRVALADLEVSPLDIQERRYPSDFSLDIVLNGSPAEEQVLITYSKLFDLDLSKCLTRLACYHSVKANEKLVNQLELLGFPRYAAFLCLSMCNNDYKQAHDLIDSMFQSHSSLRPTSARVSGHKDRHSKRSDTSSSERLSQLEGLEDDNALERAAASATRLQALLNQPVRSRSQRTSSEASDKHLSNRTSSEKHLSNKTSSEKLLYTEPERLSRTSTESSHSRAHNVMNRLEQLLSTSPPKRSLSMPLDNPDQHEIEEMESLLNDMRKHRPRMRSRQNQQRTHSETSSQRSNTPTSATSNQAQPIEIIPPDDPPMAPPLPELPVPPPAPELPPLGVPTNQVESEEPKIRARAKLHWNEIRNVEGSVWNEISEAGKTSVKMDILKFEELFCVVPGQEPRKPKRAVSLPKNQFTTFFPIRRSNNIAIGLSRFHRRGMTTQDVFKAIEVMDRDQMSSDDLITFSALLPTLEEQRVVRQYAKQTPEHPFAPAERFAIDTLDHPDIQKQLLAFLFAMQYPVELEDLFLQLDKLIQVTHQIKNSEAFKALLKVVLELGNMTNYQYSAHSTSYRPWMGNQARALGFKIDGLARLAEVKSADGKWNLMIFLVDMIERQQPELLSLPQELQDLSIVRSYDIRAIALQLKNIITTHERISTQEFTGIFLQAIKPVIEDAREQLDICTFKFHEFVATWTETIIYLGEDIDDYMVPSLEVKPIVDTTKKLPKHLYVSLDMFLQSYKQAVIANRQRNEDIANRMVRQRKLEHERELRELREMRQKARMLAEQEEEPESPEDDIPTHLQPEHLEEASQMFKRLSMMPPSEMDPDDQIQSYQYQEEHLEY
ncbi:hypothetical protein EDD86DRAFT_196458 [Gorgonomyces haynaldii]|nr:hypothetical protein EDD86DRAFT_196458 [Gorgonomyces haynaldii]